MSKFSNRKPNPRPQQDFGGITFIENDLNRDSKRGGKAATTFFNSNEPSPLNHRNSMMYHTMYESPLFLYAFRQAQDANRET